MRFRYILIIQFFYYQYELTNCGFVGNIREIHINGTNQNKKIEILNSMKSPLIKIIEHNPVICCCC